MKNKRLIYIMSILLAFSLWGCEKDYDTVSRLTFFPDFAMEGSSVMFHDLGNDFVEPGVEATADGKVLELNTSISGDFFGSSDMKNDADKYIINYRATNSDGFDGSTSRTVFVFDNGDLTTSIEGLYTSTIVRNGKTGPAYTDTEYVMISKTSANTYKLSDAIGGYYDMGRGYGGAYRARGITITANDIAANDFSFSAPVKVGPWSDGELVMKSMTVDAASKTIVYESSWTIGYDFVVTLKQVEL